MKQEEIREALFPVWKNRCIMLAYANFLISEAGR